MFLIYSIRENEDRYEEAHHLYNRILRHFSSAAASAYTKQTYFLGNRTAAFSGGANAENVRRHDTCTMAAFWGNANALIQTAAYCARHGDSVRAEHWLRYGALDLQLFPVLVAYGDFLAASAEKKTAARADYWYAKAQNQVLAQPPFPARNDLMSLLQQKRAAAMQKRERAQ